MKFLIHSNAPNANTGYGVQCGYLAERLHDAGQEVAISASYGQQGSIGRWRPKNPRNPELWPEGHGIRVYPQGYHLSGADIVHNHALDWFGGDPLNGWVIILQDVWTLAENPLLADFNVAGWAPVDHFPTPTGVLEFFDNSGAVPVAMSRFGEGAFRRSGLDPQFVPLAVDTNVYKPTPTLDHAVHGTIPARHLLGGERYPAGIPDTVFLVGMVAMNKDPNDRKGFNEAFSAFGAFHRRHPDSILYVHADKNGMGTSFPLDELAAAHGIPPHAIVFPVTYGYQMGWSSEMMAAAYTAFDVLLAPSHGEGFCVPIIEAQACGTPVIASNFTAQPELVGSGWIVNGQPLYDFAHHSFYIVPAVDDIVEGLVAAYHADLDELEPKVIAKAQEYDADHVYDTYWAPLIEKMVATPELPPLNRDEPFKVDVIVPLMREENLPGLIYSFKATAPNNARLVVVQDGPQRTPLSLDCSNTFTGKDSTTFAEKVNLAYSQAMNPWVLLVGDDVEFHEGWFEEAEKLSDRFDVIGTNDSLPGRTRNPQVALGKHADHFFVRRSYVDTYGACLDGPKVLAPEVYKHWFVDREIIELAKARCTFAPCLTSVIEHHHPGYDGREDLRFADPTYAKAVELSTGDEAVFESRRHLIDMQRQTLGRRS